MIDYKVIVPEETQLLMESIVSKIPKTLKGAERISFLIDNFSEISIEDKYSLMNLVDNLLKYMVEKEASDIELGGFGSEGFIWFRIYGQKNPVEELPKFTDDESAILILSLMSDKQRNILENIRNLDFSYTVYDENNKYAKAEEGNIFEIRFRVDALL